MPSLQVRYRPNKLEEMVGNKSLIESLSSVLNKGFKDQARSFLFVGPSGCGKTTLGRILKEEVKISAVDFHEFDAANTRGIDTIRLIRSEMGYAPLGKGSKMYLLDECHQITHAAQEALLKALEEAPDHVFFVLCTTNPDQLKETFNRRCHIYQVKPLYKSEIMSLLKRILTSEEKEDFPTEVLKKITNISYGSPGHALKWLDMVIDMKSGEQMIDVLEEATCREEQSKRICQILLDGSSNKWVQIQPILKGLKGDPEQVRRSILAYFEPVMLGDTMNIMGPAVSKIVSCFIEPLYNTGRAGLIFGCYLASLAVTPTKEGDIPF